MLDDSVLLALTITASFIAAVLQAATGFGFAVLAVPLYLLLLPAGQTVQLTILVSCLVMAVMTAGLWRAAPWRFVGMVALGTVLGAPLGLWFLSVAPERLIKAVIASVLAGFVAYILLKRRRGANVAANDRPAAKPLWEATTGVFAGALGAGIGMPGPPLLIYFGLAGGGKDIVRPAIMAYLLVAFIGIAALNAATVGFAAPVLLLALWQVPAALLGCAAGGWLAGRLDQSLFDRITLGALALTVTSTFYSVFSAPSL